MSELDGKTYPMAKAWPTLYKTTSTGKEQEWMLNVFRNPDSGAAEIVVTHGQVGGKKQVSKVTISQGKNIGKSNETTSWSQAVAEAQAKWLKQKDRSYSEERGGASVDLKPMLAHDYSKHKGKLTFPCFWQPKLDGCRCIAHRSGDTISLLSRQGKEHVGLAHIRRALMEVMKDGDVLDGELYTHGMEFQTIISLVKKDRPESVKVQYHVYDAIVRRPFIERCAQFLKPLKARCDAEPLIGDNLCVVQTNPAGSHADIDDAHQRMVSIGYEGIMLRVGDCSYRCGYRSHELLKVKAFLDADFEIVDVSPGRGKFENQGIFTLKTENGTLFDCVPKGTESVRQVYLADRLELKGKRLTVKFFEWTTSESPVPRFPVGIGVRLEQ